MPRPATGSGYSPRPHALTLPIRFVVDKCTVRVYVTGATGYIGSAICRRLVEASHDVRALVRHTSNRDVVERLGVACFEGDLRDRVSMREGMSGADWVIHAAAELDFKAPRERIAAANVAGSENVASLAWKLGVGRVLHISSIAVFGGSAADGSPSTEESPQALPLPNAYCETKHAGEQCFRTFEEKGLRLNIVYPSLVYGPPSKKGGINSFLRALLLGRLPAVVGADRVSSWVYLDDLVDGVLRVMEDAEPGAHYLLSGEKASTTQIVEAVCTLGGVSSPRLNLSPFTARMLLAALGPLAALVGRPLPFNSDQLASLSRHWHFDDSRARRDLDWRPRGLDRGLPPTIDFLKTTIRQE